MLRGRGVAEKRTTICAQAAADEVERLVSGARAYICDACATECVAVLERHGGFSRPN